MLTLKENQKIYVLKSDNRWFTCVSDNNGLISYSDNPFLFVDKEGTKINMNSFQSCYNEIKNFELEKEIENLKTVESYSKLVDKIIHLQNVLFDMSAFGEFIEESKMPEDYKKGTALVCDDAKKRIEVIEALFQTVAKNVPSNWAYAMFPESSWTGYLFLVEKHRIACGNTTRFAESYGRTLSDAKEADRNSREFREALKQDIHKEEKIFLDLQKQIRIKEQTEDRIL